MGTIFPFIAMPPPPPDRPVIDEILRPSGKAGAGSNLGKESEVARFLAKWLDNWLRIPGTNFKVGLDPILALFPGVGSALASGGGLLILVESIRAGISFPVLLRMGGNMLLNTLFDFLPVGGPVVSAFFKSNVRNLRLLQAWQAGQQQTVKRSTTRMFVFLGVLVVFLIALLVGLFTFYVWLLQATGLVK
ncbi:DUF4112 domain-containing protein [Prosthecobacter dejongeii]|uniref:DUF4112 domain-containing protein n=1 Tax=Prosthecobacter dejongeii TaxID=48465 RepID=UPI001C865F32|nr:DUF4112 domain-containing protein [Prosthecobacter dejongeii]